jgi:hypothetical protein
MMISSKDTTSTFRFYAVLALASYLTINLRALNGGLKSFRHVGGFEWPAARE